MNQEHITQNNNILKSSDNKTKRKVIESLFNELNNEDKCIIFKSFIDTLIENVNEPAAEVTLKYFDKSQADDLMAQAPAAPAGAAAPEAELDAELGAQTPEEESAAAPAAAAPAANEPPQTGGFRQRYEEIIHKFNTNNKQIDAKDHQKIMQLIQKQEDNNTYINSIYNSNNDNDYQLLKKKNDKYEHFMNKLLNSMDNHINE